VFYEDLYLYNEQDRGLSFKATVYTKNLQFMHECQCCIYTNSKNRAIRNRRWRVVHAAHAVVPERPRTVGVDEWGQQDLLARDLVHEHGTDGTLMIDEWLTCATPFLLITQSLNKHHLCLPILLKSTPTGLKMPRVHTSPVGNHSL
jgi:hypothetical protein